MSKRIWTKTPWILGIALIVGLTWYGFSPRSTEVDVGTVQKKRLVVTVNDEGEMRVRERYIVSVPVSGEMQRLDLHPGDQVVQGETVMVRLVAAPPSLLDQRTIAELRARESSAKASLDRSDELTRSAMESLGLAHHEFERIKTLRISNTVSQADFDASEHQLEVASANHRAAVFAKQVALFELETARAVLGSTPKGDSGNHAELQLVSPIHGRVLSVSREDAGFVSAGTGILTIGDPSNMEVQVEVISQDAVRIRPGAKMQIERWGGKQQLNGVVRLVEPYAFLKISALGVEEKRVRVIGDLIGDKSESQWLGDGYRVEVKIVVEETSSETLVVHSGSLFREKGEWKVFRIYRGIAQLCSVQVGATNGLETEIKSGLELDDQIILYPTDKIHDGTFVVPNR